MPISKIGTNGLDQTDLDLGLTGNVGIGTSTPTAKLHVVGSSGITRFKLESTASVASSINFVTSSDANGYINYDTGTFKFFQNYNAAASPSVIFDASGNVGIGTSTAGSKFAVVTGSATGSAIPSWSTNYAIFGPNAGSSTGAAVGVSYNTTADQGEVISVSPNNAWKPLVLFGGGIRFNGTNGSEAMRIDSSGNVLVGRTSTVSSPGSTGKLFVDGGTIINTNGTDTSAYGLDRISFNTTNYYVLNASSTGVRLGNGSTSWAAQSDERLKDIIEPIENATEKVSSLRAVIGKYKSDEDGVRRSFLIAQDLQKVLPEAVDSSTLPDGEDETEYLYIKYTEVVPLLVAAIQEQQETIESLKARIEALENK